MIDNPDSQKWVCSVCGRRTRINLRTGMAYSHSRPGSTQICSTSGTGVARPTVNGAPLHQPEPQAESTAAEDPPKRFQDGPSTSVRTVAGGMPGTNRRK
jgi:hypothetical protein